MSDQPLKFCRDCRYGEMHPSTPYAPDVSACLHPKASRAPVVNLVTGQTTEQRTPCDRQRASENADRCGITGRWWEPKP